MPAAGCCSARHGAAARAHGCLGRSKERWGSEEQGRPIFFFELVGDTIWGATAAMLRQLLARLTEIYNGRPEKIIFVKGAPKDVKYSETSQIIPWRS